VAGAPDNAVSITTQYAVPVYFVRLFTASPSIQVNATAVAYNLPLAGIAIGSAVGSAGISQLNDVITAQSGSSLNLTAAERDALDQTSISIFRLLDRIAVAHGTENTPMSSVTSAGIDLATLAKAAADALTAQAPTPTATQTTALGALTRIAQQAGNSPSVVLSDFLALGAHQKRAAMDVVSTRSDSLGVPALAILMGYLQMSKQNTLVNENETVTVPGLATISVEAVLSKNAIGGGARAAAVIGPSGASASSSQGRIRLTISLLQPIAVNVGLVHLSLPVTIPIIADLGYGSASISSISCGTEITSTTDIAVAAQSGAAQLYLGSVTNNQLTNLAAPLVPNPAQIVSIPLVSVSAQGQSTIGQSPGETLHFSWNDIANRTEKSTDGTPSLAAALTNLNSSIAVTVGSAPVGTGAIISGLVRTQVAAVLAALQPELESVLASVGLKAGTMSVRATAVRCGIPALVT